MGFKNLILLSVFGGIMGAVAWNGGNMNAIASKPVMKEIVDNYFDAFNRHDVDALTKFYSEGAVLESPEEPRVRNGRESIREHYLEFFKMIPDVKDYVKNVVIGEDQVAVEFTSKGSIPGEQGNVHKFEIDIVSIFKFKNGLIVRDATYYDTAVTQ